MNDILYNQNVIHINIIWVCFSAVHSLPYLNKLNLEHLMWHVDIMLGFSFCNSLKPICQILNIFQT